VRLTVRWKTAAADSDSNKERKGAPRREVQVLGGVARSAVMTSESRSLAARLSRSNTRSEEGEGGRAPCLAIGDGRRLKFLINNAAGVGETGGEATAIRSGGGGACLVAGTRGVGAKTAPAISEAMLCVWLAGSPKLPCSGVLFSHFWHTYSTP